MTSGPQIETDAPRGPPALRIPTFIAPGELKAGMRGDGRCWREYTAGRDLWRAIPNWDHGTITISALSCLLFFLSLCLPWAVEG